jgi:hypothetical protein
LEKAKPPRNSLVGMVVSDRMDKSIVVRVRLFVVLGAVGVVAWVLGWLSVCVSPLPCCWRVYWCGWIDVAACSAGRGMDDTMLHT